VSRRDPKFQKLRLERFRMHAAIFALGTVLGAYAATKEVPKHPTPSSTPPEEKR
jgi:hypothetical protein